MESRGVIAKGQRQSNPNALAQRELLNQLRKIDDLVGEFISYWGFKKIHGRIWLHLYTCKQPLDTAALMKRLKVSKGLMSIAIRELLDFEVILSVSTGAHGTVFYEANPDLQTVILNVLKNREQIMLAKTFTASHELLSSPHINHQSLLDTERLRSVLAFIASAQDVLDTFLNLEACEGVDIFSGLTQR